MNWDSELAWQVLPLLLQGAVVTIEATIAGTALAMVLGLFFAMLNRSHLVVVRGVVRVVVEFIRSTPLLVQLLFLYLVTLPLDVSPLLIGIVGLGVHYATYTSEVYRAGIDGVPKGQWEAATALSLPMSRTWTAVILPQAIRRVIPALGNYLVSMFKETPLLAAITVVEMVSRADTFGSQHARYLEPYTLAGLLFLLMSIPAAYFVRWLEVRFGK